MTKFDHNQRMTNVVLGAGVADMSEAQLLRLDRGQFDMWITSLRDAEASTRRLRLRLEALRDGDSRQCQNCGRPVTGRADAKFCSTNCRVAHHQGKKRTAAARAARSS